MTIQLPIALTLAPVASEPGLPGLAYYIRPEAHGGGTGLTYDDAADPSAAAALFAQLLPGGVLYLIADEGAYPSDGSLNRLVFDGGGTSGNPVQVKGVDRNLAPMKAMFSGTRRDPADWGSLGKPTRATTSFDVSGYDALVLASGLHDTVFTDLAFLNVGCCFDPLGDLTRVTLQHMTGQNVFSFFTNDLDNLGALRTEDAYLNDTVTLDDIIVTGFSIGGFRIGQRNHRAWVKNCTFDSQQQACDNFCECMHFSGTTQVSTDPDWLALNPGGGHIVQDTEVAGAFYFSSAPNYPNNLFANADGIADESNVVGPLYLRLNSHDHTDAAYDLKSENHVSIDCIGARAKEILKLWPKKCRHTRFSSDSPTKLIGTGGTGHVSLFGSNDMDITLEDFTATDLDGTKATLILPQSSAIGTNVVTLDGYSIALQPGTTVLGAVTAPGTVTVNYDPPAPTLGLAVDYRAGFDAGRIPDGTAAGTVIADLAVTGTGAAGATLELTADLHGAFAIVGTTLTVAGTVDVNAFTAHSFTVRATSPEGLATQSASGVLYVDAPAAKFSCDWNGSNGATTATDDAAGATITFSSCSLTTSAPIEGSASLLVNGGGQRCSVPDNDNWAFDGMFSLKAKINLTSLAAAAVILAHWNSSGNQRAWALQVSAAGALQLVYSSTGNATTTIASADGLIATGQTHEIAADRDLNGAVRLYLDGVMVAKATTASAFKNSTAGLTIGNTANGSAATVGRIDKTKVWKGWPFCASDAGYTVA